MGKGRHRTLERNKANAHSESVSILGKRSKPGEKGVTLTSVAARMQEEFFGKVVLKAALDKSKVGDLPIVHPLRPDVTP